MNKNCSKSTIKTVEQMICFKIKNSDTKCKICSKLTKKTTVTPTYSIENKRVQEMQRNVEIFSIINFTLGWFLGLFGMCQNDNLCSVIISEN